MRILYHHRIASKDGQYVHVEEIIKSMKKAGHDVYIVSPQIAENQGFGGDGGFVASLKAKLPRAFYEVLEFAYSFLVLFKLIIAARRHAPDFIYERYNIYNPAGVWAKKLLGIPLILEVNSPLYHERKKFDGLALSWLAQWTEQYTWNHADHVLPVTHVLAKILATQGVKNENMTVLHNGINKSDFMVGQDRGQRRNQIKAEAKVVIGFVGFCREWHGLDQIVELIAKAGNDQLFFLLVGDGPARENVEVIAQALGVSDRVYITGVVGRTDMPGWLDAIDVALQPDAVSYASPLKMIEYLAKGKAIVAPYQENICELLNDKENALLFDKEDKAALLKSVQLLATDKELRDRIKMGAAKTIEEKSLTWDNNVEKIVGISKRLIDRAGLI